MAAVLGDASDGSEPPDMGGGCSTDGSGPSDMDDGCSMDGAVAPNKKYESTSSQIGYGSNCSHQLTPPPPPAGAGPDSAMREDGSITEGGPTMFDASVSLEASSHIGDMNDDDDHGDGDSRW